MKNYTIWNITDLFLLGLAYITFNAALPNYDTSWGILISAMVVFAVVVITLYARKKFFEEKDEQEKYSVTEIFRLTRINKQVLYWGLLFVLLLFAFYPVQALVYHVQIDVLYAAMSLIFIWLTAAALKIVQTLIKESEHRPSQRGE